MDLFFTRIRLKNDTDVKIVWNIINDWLVGSPHYGIDCINYSNQEVYQQEFNTCSISILSQATEAEQVFALRFVNRESHNIWTTDCIYLAKDGIKLFTVSLSCLSKDYSSILPKIHKPYIIKKIIEANICYDCGYFPITDSPIYLSEEQLELCAKIMRGEISTNLPVTYVSYDSYNPTAYSVDEKDLAVKLSGISHVLVEPDKDFALKLKKISNGNNAYNGYIGIYYPNTTYREIISYSDFFNNGYLDKMQMAHAIRKTVQQSIINHNNSYTYSWDSLLASYHLRKLHSAEEKSFEAKKDLDDFIEAFDAEQKKKDEIISSLQLQLDRQNSIIESFKHKSDSQNSILFDKSGISEFYPGELNDLIISILSQAQNKIEPDTRLYELLSQLLSLNKFMGTGKVIFNDIEKALSSKSLSTRRSTLEKCGFTIEKGSHDKIFFHNPKYCFTLANSPSDHRGQKNMLTDILKKINVYRKIM